MSKTIKKIKTILYSLIGIFVLLLIYFAVPFEDLLKRNIFLILAILGLLFLILGIVLIILGRKEKGKIKIFLMLTGISAISPLIFSVLHNFFYALGILLENIIVIKYIMEILHVTSFIIAMVVSPIGFVIGVIASLILLRKK